MQYFNRLAWATCWLVVAIAVVPSAIADTIRNNQDLIKLIKAGLGEAVVLQAIDSSTSKLDTSTDALIALKKSGASDAVIRRVLMRSSPPPSAPAPVPASATLAPPTPLQSNPPPGNKCVDDAPEGYQAIFDEGRQINVRPAKTQFEADANAGTVLSSIGTLFSFGFIRTSVKAGVVLERAKSVTRLKGKQPLMTSIGIPSDKLAEEEIVFVKLASRDGGRYVEVGEGSTGIKGSKGQIKYPPEVIVPVELTVTGTGCSYQAQGGKTYTLNIYSAKPQSPLSPGEYALLISGGGVVVDFGIDD